MSEPTNVQKITAFINDGLQKCDSIDEISELLRKALDMAKEQKSCPFGCHCDLEPGMEPDGCVLDENAPHHCIYAQKLLDNGKTKWDCEYWKPK